MNKISDLLLIIGTWILMHMHKHVGMLRPSQHITTLKTNNVASVTSVYKNI